MILCYLIPVKKDIETALKQNVCKYARDSNGTSTTPPFPPRRHDSTPNQALVFTRLPAIYSKPGAGLGWDETTTPVKAPDLKSDPSQPPIQSVRAFC